MSFHLRPYQSENVERVRALLRDGCRSVLIESPTGSGKTAMTAFMLGSAAARGKRAWFIVHRRELVKQAAKTFHSAGNVPFGIVSTGFPTSPRQPIQICSIQTIVNRLHKVAPPDLIVFDEAHHIAAKSWSKIHGAFPRAVHIGLTATPERLDGQGLGSYFGEMVRGPSVGSLIESGYLSPYRYYMPSTASLDGVGNRAGDFARGDLESVMDTPTITGDAVSHYLKIAPGKRAVVFNVSCKHSLHTVEKFREAGVEAVHVDGDTPMNIRDAAIEAFSRGEVQVLSNVDLFGEGFDLPSLEVAILLRPTQSLGLFLQQVGRALRPSPGKDHAVILDHAGNVLRHGLPDQDREWSLDQAKRAKRAKSDSFSVRTCPKCFAALHPAARECRYCQTVLPSAAREVEQVSGELRELTADERAAISRQRKAEQSRCDSLEDLIALGQKRGYKNPAAWAEHVFSARHNRGVMLRKSHQIKEQVA